MHICSAGRILLNQTVQRQLRGPLLNLCRGTAFKYVNTRRYQLDEVNVIGDEDPKATKIIEKHGKAWHVTNESNTTTVAQTVSGDFDMYNGLQRAFYLQFYKNLINFDELKEKRFPLGAVVPFQNGNNFVYFMIIRENWWDRGAYRPLREALKAMRDHAVENNVKNITMGRLGAQEDGLDFTECYNSAKDIFYDSGVTLTFYVRTT